MSADRELRVEDVVAASPEQVWAVLTDFANLASWSPETVRMVPLLRGGLRVGQQYLGINRRKALIWPTRNVVAAVEPARRLVWDTRSSGAQWVWELEPDGAGTRVTHRRPVPKKLTTMSTLVAGSLLGGAESHADELEEGMATTLAGLKAAVEKG